jgi:hypothetical protein
MCSFEELGSYEAVGADALRWHNRKLREKVETLSELFQQTVLALTKALRKNGE